MSTPLSCHLRCAGCTDGKGESLNCFPLTAGSRVSAAESMGGNYLAAGFSGSSSLRGLVWSLVVFVSPCTLLNLSNGNCRVIFGY